MNHDYGRKGIFQLGLVQPTASSLDSEQSQTRMDQHPTSSGHSANPSGVRCPKDEAGALLLSGPRISGEVQLEDTPPEG